MENPYISEIIEGAKHLGKLLESSDKPGELDLEEFEKAVDRLVKLLSGINDELNGLRLENKKKETEIQGLQKKIEELESHICELDRIFEQKRTEHQELERIVFQIQQPDTKIKSDQLKQLEKDVELMQEELSRETKEMKTLEQEYEDYQALETEISTVINNTRDLEVQNLQLEKDIEELETELRKITHQEIPVVKQELGRSFLAVLRIALKARHENLNPPVWDEVLEIGRRISSAAARDNE